MFLQPLNIPLVSLAFHSSPWYFTHHPIIPSVYLLPLTISVFGIPPIHPIPPIVLPLIPISLFAILLSHSIQLSIPSISQTISLLFSPSPHFYYRHPISVSLFPTYSSHLLPFPPSPCYFHFSLSFSLPLFSSFPSPCLLFSPPTLLSLPPRYFFRSPPIPPISFQFQISTCYFPHLPPIPSITSYSIHVFPIPTISISLLFPHLPFIFYISLLFLPIFLFAVLPKHPILPISLLFLFIPHLFHPPPSHSKYLPAILQISLQLSPSPFYSFTSPYLPFSPPNPILSISLLRFSLATFLSPIPSIFSSSLYFHHVTHNPSHLFLLPPIPSHLPPVPIITSTSLHHTAFYNSPTQRFPIMFPSAWIKET